MNKTWEVWRHANGDTATEEELQVFLEDLWEVMERHKMFLGHEDEHGNFRAERLDPDALNKDTGKPWQKGWLFDAYLREYDAAGICTNTASVDSHGGRLTSIPSYSGREFMYTCDGYSVVFRDEEKLPSDLLMEKMRLMWEDERR